MNDVITSAVRGALRKRMLLGIILIAVAAVAGAFSANAYRNAFEGPYPADNEALIRADSVDEIQQYYITITSDSIRDTGFERVTTEDGRETSRRAYALMLVAKDRYMLVQTRGVFIPTHLYTGALVPIPNDVQSDIISDLTRARPSLEDTLLPFMLEEKDIRDSSIAGLAAVSVTALVGLFLLTTGLRMSAEPSRHAYYKRLAHYGDPQVVAGEINAELAMGGQTLTKNITLTRGWLVDLAGGRFQAVRLADMAWMYQKVIQHRTNFVPTGKTYQAELYDRHGKLTVVPGKREQVEALLAAVLKAAPWVVAGYSTEIAALWQKERAKLIAAVDARKASAGKSGA